LRGWRVCLGPECFLYDTDKDKFFDSLSDEDAIADYGGWGHQMMMQVAQAGLISPDNEGLNADYWSNI